MYASSPSNNLLHRLQHRSLIQQSLCKEQRSFKQEKYNNYRLKGRIDTLDPDALRDAGLPYFGTR